MNLAQLVDTIPVVQSTADRTAKFPTPLQDQRAYNKATAAIERFDNGAWLTELPFLASSNLTLPGTLSVVGDLTAQARLLFTQAISKLVPGVTSFSHRNNADNADNLLIVDVGDVTVRRTLGVGVGAGGAVGSIGLGDGAGKTMALNPNSQVLGMTSNHTLVFIVNNLARWNIDTAGNLIGDPVNTGYIKLGPAVSKIIPGATSLAHRNNADTTDNLYIADSGIISTRSDIVCGNYYKFATAVSRIQAGATSLSLRNSADNADNLLLTDAGVATLRNLLQATGLQTARVTKTGAYTATTQDCVILGDATTGAFSVTLPTAVGNSGLMYRIKKIDSSANVVTVATNGGNIDGAATKALSTQYASIDVQSDGTNWFIL